MSKRDFRILLEKYIAGTLSQEEKKQLAVLLHSDDEQTDLESLVDETFSDTSFREHPSPEISAIIFNRIMAAKNITEAENENAATLHYINPTKRRITWIYAAAVITAIAGAGIIFQVNSKKENEPAKENTVQIKDIAPPSVAKAVITLSNGKHIILDSAGNGILAMQGSTNVIKMADGQIVYSTENKKALHAEPEYNTLTVPRGSKVVSITLADGTKVWLNASSSLRYPTAFTGSERKVEITGEVYFEVAKDNSRRFIVDANGVSTRVFGTHFNINSYADEPAIEITLLEGSVNVSRGNNKQVLVPGQKAEITPAGNIAVTNNVDLEEVMAWKDGRFQFGGADIKEVMREITRWYDVEIVYKGDIPQHFRGGISRNVEVSKVFKMLEATDVVHFKIEDKKVIVTP